MVAVIGVVLEIFNRDSDKQFSSERFIGMLIYKAYLYAL